MTDPSISFVHYVNPSHLLLGEQLSQWVSGNRAIQGVWKLGAKPSGVLKGVAQSTKLKNFQKEILLGNIKKNISAYKDCTTLVRFKWSSCIRKSFLFQLPEEFIFEKCSVLLTEQPLSVFGTPSSHSVYIFLNRDLCEKYKKYYIILLLLKFWVKFFPQLKWS